MALWGRVSIEERHWYDGIDLMLWI